MEYNVQRSWQQQTNISPDIQRMANQVREVMSTVPMNVIIRDLGLYFTFSSYTSYCGAIGKNDRSDFFMMLEKIEVSLR